jgi:Type IV secretion system pilin
MKSYLKQWSKFCSRSFPSIFGLSAPSLQVCGNNAQSYDCTYASLVTLANNIIHLIFYVAVIFALGSFAYTGWLYLTAGGDSGKVSHAKGMFWNVFIGFVWICVAWLVVHFIVSPLINTAGGFKEFSI